MDLTGSITDFLKSSGVIVAYFIIFLIIFAESGILIGFFLPGDSLLLTLGVLAGQGYFNLYILLVLCIVGAITGDSVGYAFGRKVGPTLFNRPDSRFFKKKNLQRAHDFYEKYGPRTIVLARFVPFARTFAPIIAGMGNMNYRTFLTYNIAGGVGWVLIVTLLGYWLGHALNSNVDHYILLIVGAIIILSALPVYLEWRHHRKSNKAA